MAERRIAGVMEEEDFFDRVAEESGVPLDQVDDVVAAIVGMGYCFAPISVLATDAKGSSDA